MKMSWRNVLKVTGYSFFGLVSLVVSLYLTFPSDVLGQKVVDTVNRQIAGDGWSVSVGSSSLARLTGMAFTKVKLRRQSPGSSESTEITLDNVRVRLRILPLFILKISYDVTVELGEGSLWVRVWQRKGGAIEMELEADEVDFASPPVLGQLLGLPIGGKLNGTMRASWSNFYRDSLGAATLEIAKTSLGPGTVAAVAIPGVELGDLRWKMEIKAGRLELSGFEQEGGQIKLRLAAAASLRAQAQASTMDICVQFKPEEAFLSDNPKMAAALELAELRLKKDAGKYLHVPLAGTFAQPRLQLAGGGLCRSSGR